MEMHLEACRPMTAHVAGRRVRFAAGETIHTENSYKHTVPGFTALANRAGWAVMETWVSAAPEFAVFLLG